jgi:hypothetical protein
MGLYRLQRLLDRRDRVERDIRSAAAHPMILGAEIANRLPLDDIATHAKVRDYRPVSDQFRRRNAERPMLKRSQRALAMFEAWNLLVIVAALVGFNHVPALAACVWTLRALWPVAVITAVLTGYCVFVWTRE